MKPDLSLTSEKLDSRGIHADGSAIRRLLAYGMGEAKRLLEGVGEIGQLVTALEKSGGYLWVNEVEVKRLLADYIRILAVTSKYVLEQSFMNYLNKMTFVISGLCSHFVKQEVFFEMNFSSDVSWCQCVFQVPLSLKMNIVEFRSENELTF